MPEPQEREPTLVPKTGCRDLQLSRRVPQRASRLAGDVHDRREVAIHCDRGKFNDGRDYSRRDLHPAQRPRYKDQFQLLQLRSACCCVLTLAYRDQEYQRR